MATQSLPDNNPFQQEEGKGLNRVEQSEHLAQALTPHGFMQIPPRYVNQPRSPDEKPIRLFYQREAEERLREANRKVYSILTMQLAIVGLIVVLLYTNGRIHEFIKNTPSATVSVGLVNLGSWLILPLGQSFARAFPTNFLFLFLFTLTNAILAGVIAIHNGIETVLIVIGIIALIYFSLTVFTFQTSYDFTGYEVFYFLILLVFIIVTVIVSFFARERPIPIIIAGIGLLVFSCYLVHNTELMIGGEHAYAFTPEDYVFAALSLYLDIIIICLFCLIVIGEKCFLVISIIVLFF